ncbi:MAG: AAA family ATPase [Anaerohalosphaeraceae bacterium]
MEIRRRLYDTILARHLSLNRQMAFVSGARQVGKTTTCRLAASKYFNWDNLDDRSKIVKGPAAVAEQAGLNQLGQTPPVVLFDELHKFRKWKLFLKGFFDTYADQARIVVTGSSRLDIYRRGGDSLMGRYFLYRMHPFTAAETVRQDLPDSGQIVRSPKPVPEEDYAALWEYGGYPEPFLRRDAMFSRQWHNLRQVQLLREDVRDLTRIQQMDQLELLVHLLLARSGSQLVYSSLAAEVGVTIDTVRRWIATLCNLHFGFLIRPWFKNVSRSLRKEPKWFVRDWSLADDAGRRAETFVACHLLKAVEGWNDLGLGTFVLGYVRDVYQRETDFIVVRDGRPWFLAEVKTSDTKISPALSYFQRQLKVPFAFQVVMDEPYVDADCFSRPHQPIIVPARTFLSQLL